ncbi:hypothetical protein ACIA49_03530 [Kribbella sp. NPDC051587]|uniref:hypothetical protein n=1 Tax=Kribbella sp. NPDC051587 TaxID=3364119 RepID=UPI0037B404D9
MTKQVSRADTAIAIAEAFSRTPPKWAVEERLAELHEAGEPSMSLYEATSVLIAEAFGSETDQGRIAEAQKVLNSGAQTESVDAQHRMTDLIGEVAKEAERVHGMSPERAKLEAQSQALLCRETANSVAGAVANLEAHLQAMRQSPGRARHVSEGTR